jgi:hypothetical protein
VDVKLNDNGKFNWRESRYTITDNCDVTVTFTSATLFDCTNHGTTETVTAEFFDGTNTVLCDVQLNILDKRKPVAICKDITVAVNANGKYTVQGSELDNGSWDNCGISELKALRATWTCSEPGQGVGTHSIKLRVTDVNGNIKSAKCNITITDPLGVCPPPTRGVIEEDLDVNATDEAEFDAEYQEEEMGQIMELKAYPNPFRTSTTIEYELAESGNVRVSVYDLHGSLNSVLIDSYQEAGKQKLEWTPNSGDYSGLKHVVIETDKGERKVVRIELIR